MRRVRIKGGKPVAEQLVDAAEAVIGQSGVDGVSLRQIATLKALGILSDSNRLS